MEKVSYNWGMKQVQITTTSDRTIFVPLEAGRAIQQAMEKNVSHVVINKENNHIIKISTIAEMKDVWAKDPNQKVLNTGNPKDNRASLDSDAYQEFQKKKAQLFGK